MTAHTRTLTLALFLIAIGVGWLATSLGVGPRINWIWTLGLAVVGLLAIVVGGLDKVTVVVGPTFMITSILSVLRQTGRISMDIEIPILVIVVGILLLVARHPAIPTPKWITEIPRGPED